MKYYKTIYIGPTGSGKSYKAINQAINNEGTTILVNGCVDKSYYQKAFPAIRKFNTLNVLNSRRSININNGNKYYIYNDYLDNDKNYLNIAKSIALNLVEDEENALVLFDDNSWNDFRGEKETVFEKLTQNACGISIVVQHPCELFDEWDEAKVSEKLSSISKKWNIVYCACSDWDKDGVGFNR